MDKFYYERTEMSKKQHTFFGKVQRKKHIKSYILYC